MGWSATGYFFFLTNSLFCVIMKVMGNVLSVTILGFYVGLGLGDYSPALDDYKPYMGGDRLKQNKIYRLNMDYTLPFIHFPISAGVGYFTTKSYQGDYSLTLVPISVVLSVVSEFAPALLFGEVGIGYERVYARFARDGKKVSGWGNGLLLTAGVSMVLPRGFMFDIGIKAKDGRVKDIGNKIFSTDENLDLIFSDTYISFGIRYQIIGRR